MQVTQTSQRTPRKCKIHVAIYMKKSVDVMEPLLSCLPLQPSFSDAWQNTASPQSLPNISPPSQDQRSSKHKSTHTISCGGNECSQGKLNTLPETNSSPLKMMVSNRNLLDSRGPLFSGAMLNFREGKRFDFNKPEHANISLSRIFWTSKT